MGVKSGSCSEGCPNRFWSRCLRASAWWRYTSAISASLGMNLQLGCQIECRTTEKGSDGPVERRIKLAREDELEDDDERDWWGPASFNRVRRCGGRGEGSDEHRDRVVPSGL